MDVDARTQQWRRAPRVQSQCDPGHRRGDSLRHSHGRLARGQLQGHAGEQDRTWGRDMDARRGLTRRRGQREEVRVFFFNLLIWTTLGLSRGLQAGSHSLARDRTQYPGLGAQSLGHWTTRKVLRSPSSCNQGTRSGWGSPRVDSLNSPRWMPTGRVVSIRYRKVDQRTHL